MPWRNRQGSKGKGRTGVSADGIALYGGLCGKVSLEEKKSGAVGERKAVHLRGDLMVKLDTGGCVPGRKGLAADSRGDPSAVPVLV